MESGEERSADSGGLERNIPFGQILKIEMKLLEPKIATETWVRRGILDLFLAFELFDTVNIHLFFLQQGVEKIFKARLIAFKAPEYQNLEFGKAAQWMINLPLVLGTIL